MATGNWQVISRMIGGVQLHIVGRQRDLSLPLIGENVEYAPDSHYTTDEAKAKKLAEALNKQTSE